MLICHGINVFELGYAYWCLQWIMLKEEAAIDNRMKKLDEIRPPDLVVANSGTSLQNDEKSPHQMWPTPNLTPQFDQSRPDGPHLELRRINSDFGDTGLRKFPSESTRRQNFAMTLPQRATSGIQEFASDPQYGRAITKDTAQNIQNDMKINGINRFSNRDVADFDRPTVADAPSPTRTVSRQLTNEFQTLGTGISYHRKPVLGGPDMVIEKNRPLGGR
jgi:hypothetical protein